MAESIKQQEQKRMDRVVDQIKQAQKKAQKNIATAKSDAQAIQDDLRIISVSRRGLIRG